MSVSDNVVLNPREADDDSVSSYMNEEEESMLKQKVDTLKSALHESVQKDKLKFSVFDLKRTVEYCKNNVLQNNNESSNQDKNASDQWKDSLETLLNRLNFLEHELSSKVLYEPDDDEISSLIAEMDILKFSVIEECSAVNERREANQVDRYTSRIFFVLLVTLVMWGLLQVVLSH